MAKKKTKTIAKAAAALKNIEIGLAKLAAATEAVEHGVAVRGKDAKKDLVLVKRLGKREKSLSNRKRIAAGRAKTDPSKDTNAALRSVTSELAKTQKELTKARAAKKANSDELTALRGAQRRLRGYNKGIDATDKGLAK